MAEDIVQTVKVEGADQAASEFDKVAQAGTGMSKAVAEAGGSEIKRFNRAVAEAEKVGREFGKSLRDFGSASQRFVSNLGRMGATVTKYAAAAGLGIAAIKKFSAASQDQSEDTKQAIAANRLYEQSISDAAKRAIDNAKSIREMGIAQSEAAQDAARNVSRSIEDIEDAYKRGEISREDANKKIKRTEEDAAKAAARRRLDDAIAIDRAIAQQQREEEAIRQKTLAESAEREATIRGTEAINKAAAERKAYADAVRNYGADTASALTQLGPAYDSFLRKLNEGPSVIADIMRGITILFNKHGDEIVKIVNEIGDAFASLFAGDEAGDRATGFAETMMSAIRGVASAIKDYLIPGIKSVIGFFDQVAAGLNKVFGTNVTGAVLAIGAAFVVFSGALPAIAAGIMVVVAAFKALSTALAAMGSLTPIGVAIRLIIAALVLMYVYWDDIKKVVGSVVDYVTQKWGEFVDWFKRLVNSINQVWIDAWEGIKQIPVDAYNYMTSTWDGAVAYFSNLWDKIKSGAQTAWEWIKKQFGFGGAASAGAGAEGKKRGGPIHGRGTSTSDSVPIWASRGEWVIRAQAAQYYGRRFMGMVNSMRWPRDFSLADSLVLPSPKSRFAMGGEVGERGSSRILNLTLPGLGSFPGLTGPDETMDRLQVAAIRAQIRSAGRLPGWYGGR